MYISLFVFNASSFDTYACILILIISIEHLLCVCVFVSVCTTEIERDRTSVCACAHTDSDYYWRLALFKLIYFQYMWLVACGCSWLWHWLCVALKSHSVQWEILFSGDVWLMPEFALLFRFPEFGRRSSISHHQNDIQFSILSLIFTIWNVHLFIFVRFASIFCCCCCYICMTGHIMMALGASH